MRLVQTVRVTIPFHRNIDRKSTRLNSSHLVISYAVFCLKKKNQRISGICRYLPLHACDARAMTMMTSHTSKTPPGQAVVSLRSWHLGRDYAPHHPPKLM